MSEHTADIHWQRGDGDFAGGHSERRHERRFDGGAVVAASASPSAVPAPWSHATAVDPEEAFIAAISSCQILWFLSLSAERSLVIDRYEDPAVGGLARVALQRMAISEVRLRPRVVFDGLPPDAAANATLHDAAHARCFIGDSVTGTIVVEPKP